MSSGGTAPNGAERPGAVDGGRSALVGLATIVAAVRATVVVYFIAAPLVGYDPRFPPLASVGGAIIFTVVPAIVAVVLYALLLRFAANPVRIFAIVAVIVLVVSFIPDVIYVPTVPGSSTGQTVVLMVMHVVAAVVIVGMLTSLARPRAR